MKVAYFLVLVLIYSSCNSSQKNDVTQNIEKPKTSIVKKHDAVISVEPKYEARIEEWKEYENFKTFIDRYKAISPDDAINNSRELKIVTKSLNDSLKPKIFESPAFNARLNLLLNETLRLFDMSSIPAIKPEETDLQVKKILNAFSSVNSKINTIIKQNELDSSVEDVDFKRKEFSDKETVIRETRKPIISKPKTKTSIRSQKLKEDFLKKKKANFGKATPKKINPTISLDKKKKKDESKKDN